MSTVEALWLAGILICAAVGVGLALVRLPGTWLVLAAAVVHSWYYQWQRPGTFVLAGLAALALTAEVLDVALGALFARRAGATPRACWYGLLGGIAGMFVFAIPLPVVGVILGGALGCFCGAVVGELTEHGDLHAGTRVGVWAAIGQVCTTFTKTAAALAMSGWLIASLLLAAI